MRPDTVHAVEHAFGLPVQIALNAQRRKLVRHHAHGPSRSVAGRRWPSVRVRPVGLDLWRRLALIPVAEGTESPLDLHVFADKVGGTLGPVGRNNHPAANNRIFSKLRQSLIPFRGVAQTSHFTPTGMHSGTL